MRTILIMIPEPNANYSYFDSDSYSLCDLDIYCMQDCQLLLEWIGMGFVGLIAVAILLMIRELL